MSGMPSTRKTALISPFLETKNSEGKDRGRQTNKKEI